MFPDPMAQIRTSNKFMMGMLAILAVATAQLGPLAMFNLYFVPYWVNVVWLDVVTYLHHHGSEEVGEQLPWYRGKVRESLFLAFGQRCWCTNPKQEEGIGFWGVVVRCWVS